MRIGLSKCGAVGGAVQSGVLPGEIPIPLFLTLLAVYFKTKATKAELHIQVLRYYLPQCLLSLSRFKSAVLLKPECTWDSNNLFFTTSVSHGKLESHRNLCSSCSQIGEHKCCQLVLLFVLYIISCHTSNTDIHIVHPLSVFLRFSL